jgi:hypothetical protein
MTLLSVQNFNLFLKKYMLNTVSNDVKVSASPHFHLNSEKWWWKLKSNSVTTLKNQWHKFSDNITVGNYFIARYTKLQSLMILLKDKLSLKLATWLSVIPTLSTDMLFQGMTSLSLMTSLSIMITQLPRQKQSKPHLENIRNRYTTRAWN